MGQPFRCPGFLMEKPFVPVNTEPPWSTGGQEHARTYDSRRLCVRQLYDHLWASYEISKRKAPPTFDVEYWQDLGRVVRHKQSSSIAIELTFAPSDQ